MTISNAMVVYPDSQINSSHIKSGDLSIDKNFLADNIADFLNSEEVSRLKFRNTRPFVLAIRKAFEIYTKKQLNKLRKNSIMIPMCANYSQYLTVFENIIKQCYITYKNICFIKIKAIYLHYTIIIKNK